MSGREGSSRYRSPGQVCPNGFTPEGDCHIDQRFEGFDGLACPHCACELVLACSRCDYGSVVEVEGEPYCHVHDPLARTARLCQSCRVEHFGGLFTDRKVLIKYQVPAMGGADDPPTCDACDEQHSNGVYAYLVPEIALDAALDADGDDLPLDSVERVNPAIATRNDRDVGTTIDRSPAPVGGDR